VLGGDLKPQEKLSGRWRVSPRNREDHGEDLVDFKRGLVKGKTSLKHLLYKIHPWANCQGLEGEVLIIHGMIRGQ